MKKVEKNTNTTLSHMEWTTLWMAVRYSMNRGTIVCATLPMDIIKYSWDRLSNDHKTMLARDIKSQAIEDHCDENWTKLQGALDIDNYLEIDDKTCFLANDKTYVLKTYIQYPWHEMPLNTEKLK